MHKMSFKNLIINAYGSEIHSKTSRYTRQIIKKTMAKCQLTFLNRCIHHKITPRFLRVKCPLKTSRGTNVTEKFRRDLLIAARNDAKVRQEKQSRNASTSLRELTACMSEEHLSTLKRITEEKRERIYTDRKQKLKDKFELLYKEKFRRPWQRETTLPEVVKNCVLNLVDEEIPDHHKELMNLGPKFAITPNRIPFMEIISKTETEALKLERQNDAVSANVLRKEVKRILQQTKTKLPPSNINSSHRQAIKEILADEEVRIHLYDKGTGFVRMPKAMSESKMIEGIGEATILQKDPTSAHVVRIQRALSCIRKQVEISDHLYYRLYPSDAIPPRAYGQCKAHKPGSNYPFRVLVSTIGTAPYGLSKYLVEIIQPTLAKNPTMIRNSRSFVETSKTWTIDPNEIQVSYDVVALYPSVPVKKAIDNMINILTADQDDFLSRTPFTLKHIRELLEVCLYKTYFLWDNKIYCIKDSGPIGLSLMVVLAEGYLQTLENQAIEQANSVILPVAPITHKRYVDDSHDRFAEQSNANEFLSILNSIDPDNIQYTMEIESEDKILNFLDVKTKNTGRGYYEYSVHRKAAITNVQVKSNSCHYEGTLNGIFKGFIHRAKSICSPQHLKAELEFLTQVFVTNGYEKSHLDQLIAESNRPKIVSNPTPIKNNFVSMPYLPGLSAPLKKAFRKAGYKVAFKSPKNLGSILTSRIKQKLPANSSQGVYFIPTGCRNGYTGETKKKIVTRTNEHAKAIFLEDTEKDAIAAHQIECGCEIDMTKTKVLAQETRWFPRKVREALEIRRLKTGPGHGINQDMGDYVKTNHWNDLLEAINNNRKADVRSFKDLTSDI